MQQRAGHQLRLTSFYLHPTCALCRLGNGENPRPAPWLDARRQKPASCSLVQRVGRRRNLCYHRCCCFLESCSYFSSQALFLLLAGQFSAGPIPLRAGKLQLLVSASIPCRNAWGHSPFFLKYLYYSQKERQEVTLIHRASILLIAGRCIPIFG